MRWRDAPVVAAAFAAGVVQAASFVPLSAWWLQLAALAMLAVLVLRGRRAAPPAESRSASFAKDRPASLSGARRAASIGFAFGIGCFATGVSWVYVSMHRYGGMPAPLAATALLLFAAYLALFGALVAVALERADRAMRTNAGSPASRAASLGLLFAGAWTLAELARGWLFTGFPWLAIGYAHVDGPLSGFAPVLGVYGVCAMAALVAFGIAQVLHNPPGARAVALGFALLPLLVGWALRSVDWSTPHAAPLRVRLLQGNVPQEMKFDPARSLAAMRAYASGIRGGDAMLTVLPETAWTLPWSQTPPPLREAIHTHLAETGSIVAIGMPLFGRQPDASHDRTLTNSVAVIDRSGQVVWRYDKRHLVPFGEFVPFGFGWFVDLMHIPLGDFGRGSASQPPLAVGGQRVAFNICYEDLFGEEIAVQVRNGATILANVSNIAWFGDSHALAQHLQIARMRSIELARPTLRATNTGVTGAIDAGGRVTGVLPTYATASLDIEIQGHEGLTPYARHGNVLALVMAVSFVAAGALPSLRARRRGSGRTAQTR